MSTVDMNADYAVDLVDAFLEDGIEKVSRALRQVIYELERPDSDARRMLEQRIREGGEEHDWAMFRESPGLVWFAREIREELIDAVVYSSVREYHGWLRRNDGA